MSSCENCLFSFLDLFINSTVSLEPHSRLRGWRYWNSYRSPSSVARSFVWINHSRRASTTNCSDVASCRCTNARALLESKELYVFCFMKKLNLLIFFFVCLNSLHWNVKFFLCISFLFVFTTQVSRLSSSLAVDYMHMFSFTHSIGLKDEHCQLVAQKFPGISFVHWDSCDRVSDTGFVPLFSGDQGRGLRFLSLRGIREGQFR
jgi:hypothetical protein